MKKPIIVILAAAVLLSACCRETPTGPTRSLVHDRKIHVGDSIYAAVDATKGGE